MLPAELNICHISPFSIMKPRHGGQVRAQKLRAHIEAWGANVKSIGYDPASTPGDGFAELSATYGFANCPSWENHKGFYLCDELSDLSLGQCFSKIPELFSNLAAQIPARTNMLIVEQPWLHDFAVNAVKHIGLKNYIYVASTQNCEASLKAQVLHSYPLNRREGWIQTVESLELDYLRSADYVVAVSKDDRNEFKEKYFIDCDRVIVCPNGSQKIHLSIGDCNNLPQSCNEKPFALFVGSAHPPNAQGFCSLLCGPSALGLGDYRLVVAGSVCSLLRNLIPRDPFLSGLVDHGILVLLDSVEDEVLDQLVKACKIFIVPLLQGGGTNLKTASALVNNKPLLTTSVGLRGFEEFSSLRSVTIADNPSEFKNHLHRLMKKPINGGIDLCNAESSATKLQWNSTLEPIIRLFEEIA